MIWQRIKRIWQLSAPQGPLPWDGKVYDELSNMSYEDMAKIIPYQKQTPVEKIVNESQND